MNFDTYLDELIEEHCSFEEEEDLTNEEEIEEDD